MLTTDNPEYWSMNHFILKQKIQAKKESDNQ